jgi:predicted Zn-ribbon and HTH transcriptional regulator
MSVTGGGTTALDRLGARLDRGSLRCPQCGYVAERGGWTAATSGDRVRYRRRCPSCDAEATRTLRLK